MKNSQKLKKKIIQVSYSAGACHIGSALSCSDIIEDIFKRKKKKDVFVFSKASGVCALYCKMYPLKKATELLKKYPLPAKEAGLIHSLGSLGHGLPFVVGLAFADKTRDVYCLISDAEVQEGTFWESILFKKQHKLNNLKIIVDANGYQALGKIKDILDLPYKFLKENGVEVVKTKKGAGVDFMENDNSWHYKNLDKELKELAIKQLK